MKNLLRCCALGGAACLAVASASRAEAQDGPRVVFSNLYIPAGATPYSADTHAEADFLRAFGEMHFSLALAR